MLKSELEHDRAPSVQLFSAWTCLTMAKRKLQSFFLSKQLWTYRSRLDGPKKSSLIAQREHKAPIKCFKRILILSVLVKLFSSVASVNWERDLNTPFLKNKRYIYALRECFKTVLEVSFHLIWKSLKKEGLMQEIITYNIFFICALIRGACLCW